ncbi:MAG TPA: hypothetical protein VFT22_31395 [Kofleriaceae bacterium]|nr:hypothetical protein [Kofleriaceae bacterium]
MSMAIRTQETIKEANGRFMALGAGATSESEDPTLAKLIKLIPGDVVAFYVGISAFVAGAGAGYQFAVFLVGLVATPLILWFGARESEGEVKVRPPVWQYILRTAAFVLWAAATAYPFMLFGPPIPAKAIGVALAAFTLLAPFVIHDKKAAQVSPPARAFASPTHP